MRVQRRRPVPLSKHSIFPVILAVWGVLGTAILTHSQTSLKASEQGDGCRANLSRLGIAVLLYSEDYDETLPPLANPDQFRKLIKRYTDDKRQGDWLIRKTPDVFVCP